MTEDEKETLPESTLSVPRSVAEAGFAGIEIGTKIGGNYRILGRLGEGAMGVVRLARDEGLDRLVAVKLVRPERLTAPGARAELRAEARAMAKVRHPNVVGIYTIGEHEGVPYYVMEYVPGMDLETWTGAHGGPPLPLPATMALLREVSAGVSAMHDAGVVHGDLKPGNVLMAEDGRVLVTDLGLVRVVAELEEGKRSNVAGTPLYMAPEVLLARVPSMELATRIDVYSLAVIAYELLTGRPPFAESDIVRLLNMHATIPPPPPTSVAEVPRGFDDVLLAALEKDPALRLGSVAELAAGLEEACASARASRADLTLVLLDDDEDFLRLARAGLEHDFPGARVRTFSDPDAAMSALREGASAALVDLDMPGRNGLEVLAALRSAGARVPIAVVTGVGGERDRAVVSQLGARLFVSKPISPEGLSRVVRRLVDRDSLRSPPRGDAP